MLKKSNIGKIATVGFGAALLGVTAFGIGAASLSDFPSPFVSGGTGNYIVVYGNNNNGDDITSANSIANYFSTLTGGRTSSSSTQLSLGSNAFEIATDADDYLELGNQGGSDAETLGAVITTDLIEEDLALLADGRFDGNDYEQSIDLATTGSVIYANQDDELSTFLKYSSGDTMFTYQVNFAGSGAKSSIDSGSLENFIDEDITILGKTYTVTEATVGDNAAKIKLVLTSGAESANVQAGSTVTIGGKSVQVGLIYNTDAGREVELTVDGVLENVGEGETTDDFGDFELTVRKIRTLGDEGKGSIRLDYGADTITLDASSAGSTAADNVKVVSGDETNNLKADFTATGSGVAGETEYSLESFKIEFDAHEDYFILPNQNLRYVNGSGDGFLEEGTDALLGGLDIVYHGLSTEETQDISFTPSDEGQQYNMNFIDGDGNKVKIPLAYTDLGNNNASLKLGDEDHALVIEDDTDITEDDYFLLSSSSKHSTYAFKVKSVRYDTTDDEGTVIIRNLGSNEEITIDTGDLTTEKAFRPIRIGGTSFILRGKLVSSEPVLELSADQKIIHLSNEQQLTLATTALDTDAVGGGTERIISATLSEQNTDIYDDVNPTDVQVKINVTTDNNDDADTAFEQSIQTLTTFVEHPDDDELESAYTSFGTYVLIDETGDDKVFTLTTPANQIRPLVVVEGAQGASSVSVTDSGVSSGSSGATPRPSTEVENYENRNTILVGGPCANPLTAQALGVSNSPGECANDFTEGSAIIRYVEHASGNVALVVAGYSAADTRLAANALVSSSDLTGNAVTVRPGPSGTDFEIEPITQ